MMSQNQMEIIAGERIREAHEAAAARRLLRTTVPSRLTTPAWRTRLASVLGRATMRRAEAR